MPFGKRHAPELSAERRKAQRKSADISAHIVLPTGKEIRCSIRDFSPAGARIAVPSVLGVPLEFELRVGGQTYRAKIIRRGVRSLAVRFR